MVRGYRYIFVAVVGLTLIGAAPNDGGKIESKQAATQETSQDDLKRIAAALEKLPQREAQDAGCDVGKDKRDSNLCAQWKAADSANQSANWAARTFWAGVAGLCIGGLTLLFAALAAHWAKQAAIHTADGASAAQDANNISRNTLSVQLRPWVNSQGIELFITQNTIWGCVRNFPAPNFQKYFSKNINHHFDFEKVHLFSKTKLPIFECGFK